MEDTTEPQEVYIGNGITKHVTMDKKYIHCLDVKKLEKIIGDNPGKKISVGAKEDWYFTASNVTIEDIKKINEGDTGLLLQSMWDIFVVKIENNDGNIENEIDCTLNVERYPAQLAYSAGYTFGINRVERWFKKKLYHECLHIWKFEIIQDFKKEVNALIDKYESIHQNVTKYSKDKADIQ